MEKSRGGMRGRGKEMERGERGQERRGKGNGEVTGETARTLLTLATDSCHLIATVCRIIVGLSENENERTRTVSHNFTLNSEITLIYLKRRDPDAESHICLIWLRSIKVFPDDNSLKFGFPYLKLAYVANAGQ
jgi:hypothetical protein